MGLLDVASQALTSLVGGGKTGGSSASSSAGATYNILNDYRSYTYLFTLACLDKTALKNTDSYKASTQNFLILRSGGKGNTTFVAPNPTASPAAARNANDNSQAVSNIDIKSLISGFNSHSPGRFDMFIDNLEMECVIAPGTKQGNSVATSVRFEIIEPYSINGFLESLHVAAVSAGYDNYVQAPYLLKIDFMGYPDADNLPTPKIVPNSSRYFVVRFTSVEMTVTENGTKYVCEAVPMPEMSFSEPNKIKTDIKMDVPQGSTISEALGSLFENLNESLANRTDAEKSEGRAGQSNHDKYELYFPPEFTPGTKNAANVSSKYLASSKSPVDTVIGKSKMPDHLTNNTVVKMLPIDTKQTQSGTAVPPPNTGTRKNPTANATTKAAPTPQSASGEKYNPTGQVIQASQGSQLDEIINAVIRDSEYLTGILKDVDAACDSAGMITYFIVYINPVPQDTKDAISGQPLMTYQYIVVPKKIHKSTLPLQQGKSYSTTELEKQYVKRTYNYIYTGKNVDITSFKLNFNNLYFQASPPKAGNADNKEHASAARPNNGEKTTLPDNTNGAPPKGKESQLGQPQIIISDQGLSKNQTGGAWRTDPYYMFAKQAHDAILSTSVDQCTAEIEIIGDPYYMVLGGLGVSLPTLKEPGLTTDGTADHQGSEVLIKLNFRSPTDINSTTGFMDFPADLLPYSGVYRVITVASYFKDGKFTQKLDLVRMPGQIVDPKSSPEPATKLKQTPKVGQQKVQDVAPADVDKSGVKAESWNLSSVLGSAVPGLSTAGITGAIGTVPGLSLTSLGGSIGGASSLLASGSSALGGSPTSLLSGAQSLTGGTNGLSVPAITLPDASSLGTGALLGQAGDLASQVTGSPNSLLSSVSDGATSQASQLAGSVISDPTAGAASGAIQSATALANNAGGAASSAISSLGSDASSLASGIGAKASALTAGLPSDPAAIGAQLGISPSTLAGLSPQLQSQVTGQLSSITKNLPPDVDLGKLTNSGVSVGNIAGDALPNIPATAQKLLPPLPDTPPSVNADGLLASVTDKAKSLTSGLPSLGSLTGGLGLPSSLPNVASAFPADASALAGKLGSAQGMLGSVTGSLPSVEGGIGQLTNLAGGNPIAGVSAGSIAGLGNSVTAKFGDVTTQASSAASPLTDLMNGTST